MTISEKVAYLKGLAEGLDLDVEKSKEGKLIAAMMDILEDIGLTLEEMEENQLDLGEEIDAISDDLADVESAVFDDDDDDDDDCCCGHDHGDFFEVECPNCEERIAFDDSVLENGCVECPNCGEKLEFDLSELEEDEDCGCGCGCEDDD